jgi:hypothetical protein
MDTFLHLPCVASLWGGFLTARSHHMTGKPSKFSQQNEHAAERKAEEVRHGELVQELKKDAKAEAAKTEPTK